MTNEFSFAFAQTVERRENIRPHTSAHRTPPSAAQGQIIRHCCCCCSQIDCIELLSTVNANQSMFEMFQPVEKKLIKFIERRDWDTTRITLHEIDPLRAGGGFCDIITSANEKVHRTALSSDRGIARKITKAFSSKSKAAKKTAPIKNHSLALHQACRFSAPSDIVLNILSINPELATRRESTQNEYALHIAARKGLGIDVIEALAGEFPQALTAQDSNGRTPLHLSCLSGHIYPYLATVFCERALSAVAIDDNGGSTPMELFMHSDISKNRHMQECMEVLDVLHKMSSLYWENRRRQSEMYRMTLRKKRSSKRNSVETISLSTDERRAIGLDEDDTKQGNSRV